nr:MFS transporter [Aeromicrobium sp. CFBP 8757]
MRSFCTIGSCGFGASGLGVPSRVVTRRGYPRAARDNGPVTTPSPAPTTGGRWLVAAAIVLLAANLRVAVGSIGVVLGSVRDDLAMSATVAGVLTTLPVVCFAVFGVGTAGLVRRAGLHRAAAAVLVLVAAGIVTRSLVDSTVVFLLCSVVALAGAAVGNVILPPLVKAHFPDRIPLVSSMYGASLMAGASLASAATVPLSDALGGWRQGVGAWAVLSVVALVPWLLMLRRDVHGSPEAHDRLPMSVVLRSRLVWAMVLLFAAQSAAAYAQFGWFAEILTDAGISDGSAGALLAVVSAVGIPLTLSLPWLMRLTGDTPYLPWAFAAVTAIGWLGVLVAPATTPWAWAVLLGLGGGAFTWSLTMIARRTRTTAGTAALSVATQGFGYLIAGLGPFGVGALHDATGSWTAPLVCLIGLAAVIAVCGTVVARPVMLEDTLGARRGD